MDSCGQEGSVTYLLDSPWQKTTALTGVRIESDRMKGTRSAPEACRSVLGNQG